MQGYADRQLPARPISHIATYVAGPPTLVSSIQQSVAEEARKRGIAADDALNLFPPTRTYSNVEVQKALAADGVDGVLILNVGDTGVLQQYAGTIFLGAVSGDVERDGHRKYIRQRFHVVDQWYIVWDDDGHGGASLSISPPNQFQRSTS